MEFPFGVFGVIVMTAYVRWRIATEPLFTRAMAAAWLELLGSMVNST